MDGKKLNDVLQIGRSILEKNNIDAREARLLLAHALSVSTDDLIKIDSCTNDQVANFFNLLEERVQRIPFAYIVGHKEFMKLVFKVNSDVLIPREDTEVLVYEALKTKKNKVLDMCTGSGCIAISIADYIGENADVTAVDISENALKIAESNAYVNNVNVKFIKSDLFENVNEKFELIVSNPPYIKRDVIQNLQSEVKKEPILALDGGESGLEFYEKIISEAKNYLLDNGILMFEIGYDQAEDVTKLLEENLYKDIKVIKDLSGNDRVVIGKI